MRVAIIGLFLVAAAAALCGVSALNVERARHRDAPASSSSAVAPGPGSGPPPPPPSSSPSGWDYKTTNWPDICSVGKSQSPIVLANANTTIQYNQETLCSKVTPADYRLSLSYSRTDKLQWSHDGNFVSISGDFGKAVFRNVSYNLKEFRFHTRSEHQIEGLSYPLEAHFIHKTDDGHTLIFAIMFKLGSRNAFLDEICVGCIPKEAGKTAPVTRPVDLYRLNSTLNSGFYHYEGSLTTPPCTEGVTWIVFDRSQEADFAQLSMFTKTFTGDHFPNGNRRDIQPLNGRAVTHVTCRGRLYF